MKKFAYTAACLALLAAPAQAADFISKPYIGIDLQHTNYDYNSNINLGGGNFVNANTILNDIQNGFNIHVGNRFTENFGAEFGAFYNRSNNKNIANGAVIGAGPTVTGAAFSTDVKTYGLTLDGLGFLPLGSKFDLIGTVGLTWTKASAKVVIPAIGSASDTTSEIGYRGGGGGQINITDKISVRGLARYQSADFDNVAKSAWTYTLGLNYSF